MLVISVLIFFVLNISSVRSGYYNDAPKIYYQKVEPLENLEQKYFNLFLSSPYSAPFAAQSQQDIAYDAQYSSRLNDISSKCPKNALYASYLPNHKAAVAEITRIFKDPRDFRNVLEIGQFLKTRPEINPQVWFAGLMRSQASRMPETLSMQRPSAIDLFPTRFFPSNILDQSATAQQCNVLDENIGQDNGIENLLWYFREDIQMNSHHWIWHFLFPIDSPQAIPRRGEFFYFFHHELMARYTTERIANGLPPQKPLNVDPNTVIAEGYNPHLRDGISSSTWVPRPAFSRLSDHIRLEELLNITTHKNRYVQSALDGLFFRGDVNIPIHTVDNINILGETGEGSDYTINPLFYGVLGYHNQGHIIIGNISAPEGLIGAMGDLATAMRDPAFYRWHKFVDILFVAYKTTHLAPYLLNEGIHPLIVNGISVTDIRVIPNDFGGATNLLHTYWNMRRFDVFGGIDFNTRNESNPRNVTVCAKHLDHEEFTYQIQIENAHPVTTRGTVRIFMAPRYKTFYEKVRYTMAEQRALFFMMDSFQADLQPGTNLLIRRSEDSTLTAPWPKSVQQLQQEIMSGIRGRTDCECGYPHHLLLPKGTERGMTFDLFVMVTDGIADQVVENPAQQPPPQNPNIQQCTPSHIHCGIQGRAYPDAKPMGYPFDRRPFFIQALIKHPSGKKVVKSVEVPKLEDYVSYIPNSFATRIVIRHQNVQIGV